MMQFIQFALRRARVVLALMIVAFCAGLLAFIHMPREAEPDVSINFLSVTIILSGAAPGDIERLIMKPVEQELASLDSVEQIDAYATEGVAFIGIEFPLDFEPDQAVIDVREKIDAASRYFPEQTEEPVVQEYNESTFPVITVNISGPAPERYLNKLAQDIRRDVENLPGVLEAKIAGKREEMLEIKVDPAQLNALGLTASQLINIVRQNNQLIPAGSLVERQGEFSLKVPGLVESAPDLLSLPLKAGNTGAITLGDIATVTRNFKPANSFASVNGQPSKSISVSKRPGANIVQVANAVETRVEDWREDLPPHIRLSTVGDSVNWAKTSLQTLQSSVTTAIILVMIVVVASLGLRSGLLVGIAVPTSFMIAFLLLSLFGMSLNGVTMFGLVLAVGILVDGAIVVVEYADRKMEEGLEKREAYALASTRMFWPIISSTGTTLAAFLPFLFWNSVEGQFMRGMPITVLFVLIASVITALIFIPVLGNGLPGRRAALSKDKSGGLAADSKGDPRDLPGLTGLYARFAAGLIRRPLLAILAAALVLISVIFAYSRSNIRTEYFVGVQPDLIFVYVKARGNLSANEKFALTEEVREELFDIKGVELLISRTLDISPPFGFGSPPGDAVGVVEVHSFDDGDPRYRDGFEIEQEIRKKAGRIAGIQVDVRPEDMGPPVGKPIEISIRDQDPAKLLLVAQAHLEFLRSIEGVIEIEDTRSPPGIEYQLRPDRELAGSLGANVSEIGANIQMLTDGALVGTYRPDDSDEELDIRVRYPEEHRNLSSLEELRVNTLGGPVPLTSLVSREAAPKLGSVTRQDRQRLLRIRAAIHPEAVDERGDFLDAGYVFDRIKEWQSQQEFPPGMEISLGGENEKSGNAGQFFMIAMSAALFMMGIILLLQFNSFYHMFLTLFSVVLSTLGVFLGLTITKWVAPTGLFIGLPYMSTMLTGIGIVALAGIVVNNNIVLIDTFQRFLQTGFDPVEASIRTAVQRFRPVMLTTMTTICGLLPMMLGISLNYAQGLVLVGERASIMWVPLAQSVVWGLGFSTLLTLVLTPVMLALPTLMRRRFMRLLRKGRAGLRRPAYKPARSPDQPEPADSSLPAIA